MGPAIAFVLLIGAALAQDCSVPTNGPNGMDCGVNGICDPLPEGDNVFTCTCINNYSGQNCELEPCLSAPTLPAVGNATWGPCTNITHGLTCMLSCTAADYDPVTPTATCNNGTWSSTATCTKKLDCLNPLATGPGGVACSCGCVDGTDPYDGVFTCDCAQCPAPPRSGTTCQFMDCITAPASPANGSYPNCPSGVHGATCALSCDTGYSSTPSGAVATCSDGNWQLVGSCTQLPDCQNPNAVGPNGLPCACGTCVDGTALDLQYTCNCASCPSPKYGANCDLIGCASSPPLPNPLVGLPSYPGCGNVAHGGTCNLNCDANYTAVNYVAQCNNGQWTANGYCAPNLGWSVWNNCSQPCGGGTQTRTCLNPSATPCSGPDTRTCLDAVCQNCSWWWSGWSRCTRMCGLGGNHTHESFIRTPASPGAPIQCPPRYETEPCNTWMCNVVIPRFGYWYWKLCPSRDANFTYTIGSPGVNIDMFLFHDGEPFALYRKDVNREKKPRNYGYSPISTQLATENGHGEALLKGGDCYYFVVDYSYVGAAKRDRWDPIRIYHLLTGNPSDEYGYWGEGQFSDSASSLSVSSLLLAVCILFATLLS